MSRPLSEERDGSDLDALSIRRILPGVWVDEAGVEREGCLHSGHVGVEGVVRRKVAPPRVPAFDEHRLVLGQLREVDLRPELADMSKQSAPSTREGWEESFCKIVFVSISSKLAEKVYARELKGNMHLDEWNGKGKAIQMLVIPPPDGSAASRAAWHLV